MAHWNSHLSHSSFMPDNRYRRGDRTFFSFSLLPDTQVSLAFNFVMRWIVFPIIFNDRYIEKIYAISNFVENIRFSFDWRTNDREIIKDISFIKVIPETVYIRHSIWYIKYEDNFFNLYIHLYILYYFKILFHSKLS